MKIVPTAGEVVVRKDKLLEVSSGVGSSPCRRIKI